MKQEQQTGRWAKLCEEAKAKQAATPKPKPNYYYVGKKNEPTILTEGVRPCWPVRALQALVGIHWSKGGK